MLRLSAGRDRGRREPRADPPAAALRRGARARGRLGRARARSPRAGGRARSTPGSPRFRRAIRSAPTPCGCACRGGSRAATPRSSKDADALANEHLGNRSDPSSILLLAETAAAVGDPATVLKTLDELLDELDPRRGLESRARLPRARPGARDARRRSGAVLAAHPARCGDSASTCRAARLASSVVRARNRRGRAGPCTRTARTRRSATSCEYPRSSRANALVRRDERNTGHEECRAGQRAPRRSAGARPARRRRPHRSARANSRGPLEAGSLTRNRRARRTRATRRSPRPTHRERRACSHERDLRTAPRACQSKSRARKRSRAAPRGGPAGSNSEIRLAGPARSPGRDAEQRGHAREHLQPPGSAPGGTAARSPACSDRRPDDRAAPCRPRPARCCACPSPSPCRRPSPSASWSALFPATVPVFRASTVIVVNGKPQL